MEKQKLSAQQLANCKELFEIIDLDGLGEVPLTNIYSFFVGNSQINVGVDKRLTPNYFNELFFKHGCSIKTFVNFQTFKNIFLILKKDKC